MIRDEVRTLLAGKLPARIRARGPDDLEAAILCPLDGGDADAAARSVNKHGLTGFGECLLKQRPIGGSIRRPNACPLFERNVLRQSSEIIFVDERVLRVCS